MIEKSELAPIVVFAFNRPKALLKTIEALKSNPEAASTNLYLFVDGPRIHKQNEKKNVERVKDICKNITGFKAVYTEYSNTNKGLGPSIIYGVSKVINKEGLVIVLEDDLIVSPNFLAFMNQGLNRYKSNPKIWSICGYTNKVTSPHNYTFDAYCCTRSSSWGWGTWKDRWNTVDWSFDNWIEWSSRRKEFNKWGGSDCFGMLNACRSGKNKSWAIRFCFHQFLHNTISIFPLKSLVTNDGFDGNGTNCKRYSRFKYELMDTKITAFKFPSDIKLNKALYRQAMRYHSISLRVWSRLMYLLKI